MRDAVQAWEAVPLKAAQARICRIVALSARRTSAGPWRSGEP